MNATTRGFQLTLQNCASHFQLSSHLGSHIFPSALTMDHTVTKIQVIGGKGQLKLHILVKTIQKPRTK